MANESATIQTRRSPETWAWLQEHWQDVLAPVPLGTRWAMLSNDAHVLLGYGDDADRLREQAVERGESDPIIVAVPDMSDEVHI
jgi:hypothetical protein